MSNDKTKHKLGNSKDEYDDALANKDPTDISPEDLEKFAKDAIKKFKSSTN
jgi:hypothetical protein